MTEESSLVISGLTHYRFREKGSAAIHELPASELSTKQWKRFAQQISESRAEFFWQSFQRFLNELGKLPQPDSPNAAQVAEKTLEMRRLKATLRVVRDAACTRMLRSWQKRHATSDPERAMRVIRHKAGDAAIHRLVALSQEQKEILGAPQRVTTVVELRERVTWCDTKDLRHLERTFRKRIGNLFAFIDITHDQIQAFRAEAATQPPVLQLSQRAPSPQVDDLDVVAYLEDDDDDVMARLLADGANEVPKFEIQTEPKSKPQRPEDYIQQLEQELGDKNSRDAAAQQLAKINLLRKET